jgi:xanthine dehydrogenase iron-sulfur cluster and FAD-binding subunit A
MLTGLKLTGELIDRASRTIAEEIAPITDLRSTEYYRRTVTGKILAKFLRQL